MLGSIQTQFWAVRDYLSPVLLDSKFKETGRITPAEFVAAGDYLCYKFPTWSWDAGDANKKRDYLPDDKQYLVQRNVPCLRRVSQLAYTRDDGGDNEQQLDREIMLSFAAEADSTERDDGEDWVATHTTGDPASLRPRSIEDGPNDPSSGRHAHVVVGDIPDADIEDDERHEDWTAGVDLKGLSLSGGTTTEADGDEMPDMDNIPDMSDDEGEGVVEEEDEAAVKVTTPAASGNKTLDAATDKLIQVMRTYDCAITYDKYYQTPRMWLAGYDEHHRPLPPPTALEDVSSDHAHKTVTIEPFPHSSTGLTMASVHPCKHSSVMKKVVERMDGAVRRAQAQAASRTDARDEETGKKEREKKGRWGLPLPSLSGGSGAKKEKGAAGSERQDAGQNAVDAVEGLRVDQYLVVFLKFMSSIVPTIEVDATNSI